ncbi:hypothetical protein WN944_010087 [Citrus x changshan-huyou]|uniref:Uncharacterized protein n=1 Tax=Citrus x changshan-huyou TaxID=2935761 RepID=A0AAP0MTF7_9ROSI
MALCTPTQKLSLAFYAETRRTRTKQSTTVRMAASSDVATYEEGQLERPKWAGETPLSRLVGALISFKPISAVLKFGARQVLISTAEKNDIPWRAMTKEILESDVYKEMESIQNRSIVYPAYTLAELM